MEIKREEIELLLMRKEMAKITSLLNEGVPLSEFYIKNKTDILLETIVDKKISMFYNVLKRGFDIKKGQFLYLHHAVRTKELRYITEILERMKNDKIFLNNKEIGTGNNALHVATQEITDVSIIIELSKAGVSWNTQNNIGQTPVHFLLRNYLFVNKLIVNELLDKKADFNIKDNMNISSLDIINSFKLNNEWITNKNSEYLLSKINELTGK